MFIQIEYHPLYHLMLECEGKTALIIGSTSEIGEEMCNRLIKQKIGHLILTGRNEKHLNQLKNNFTNNITKCDIIQIDMSSTEYLSEYHKKYQAISKNKIDYFLFCPGTCGDMDPVSYLRMKEDVMKVININLMSAILTIEECDFNENSSAVFVSSTNSFYPLECGTSYCSTKAGLTEFAKAKAIELGKENGTRVNIVAPGLIATKFHEQYFETKEEFDDFVKEHESETVLGRNTSIECVCNTIEFLFSKLSNSITGEQIVIDSGETLVEKCSSSSDEDEENEESYSST